MEHGAALTFTVLHVDHEDVRRALAGMVTVPRRLRKHAGLGWFRYMGCGRGPGFSFWPDWNRYSFLARWDSPFALHAGLRALDNGELLGFPAQTLTFLLSPMQGKGAWDGGDPFPATWPEVNPDKPLAVLTRARVRWQALFGFWKASQEATAALATQPGRIYSIGAGANPFTELCTFSLWRDRAGMQAYARGNQAHRNAVRSTRQNDWFAEEYFGRMAIQAVLGTHRSVETMRRELAVPLAQVRYQQAA